MRMGTTRRGVLGGAGVALGAAATTPAVPARAQSAQAGSAEAGSAEAGSAEPRADEVWSAGYEARKGDVRLAMYRKRLGAPRAGEAPRPVLFLVHGSSLAALPTYDLAVPGRGEYSSMNVYARLGYDVWTVDHEGYGRSSRTASNSDVASGAADLLAAAEVVARETGQRSAHYFGQSSGSLRAVRFAMEQPERVRRLVLQAFTWTGQGSPTLGDRARNLAFLRANNRRPRTRESIRSIFTRDMPGTSDPAVAEALADAEMAYGDDIPTGTYLDMSANLPVVDPARILAPVLMVRGVHDGIATLDDLLAFFARLPNGERQFVLLDHSSHSLGLGLTRQQLWNAVHGFLSMPAAEQV